MNTPVFIKLKEVINRGSTAKKHKTSDVFVEVSKITGIYETKCKDNKHWWTNIVTYMRIFQVQEKADEVIEQIDQRVKESQRDRDRSKIVNKAGRILSQ